MLSFVPEFVPELAPEFAPGHVGLIAYLLLSLPTSVATGAPQRSDHRQTLSEVPINRHCASWSLSSVRRSTNTD